MVYRIKKIIRWLNADRLATFFGAGAATAQLLGATEFISANTSLLISGIFSILWACITNKEMPKYINKRDSNY